MGRNVVKEKSRDFALNCIQLYKKLCDEKREYVISKQLLRAATSIGANIAEANFAISKKEFLAKMYIALKEAGETSYWLDLLQASQYINVEEYARYQGECEEIISLLSAITKSTKREIIEM